jgi:hypothetical protein
MTEDPNGAKKILVDDDWKAEAQREKERLSEEEANRSRGPVDRPTFLNIVNMISMQAAMALGGLRTPQGETIPPDPDAARLYIDMLEVLAEKTAGNLTEEEKKVFGAIQYEMRMAYVQVMHGPARMSPEAGPAGGPPPRR